MNKTNAYVVDKVQIVKNVRSTIFKVAFPLTDVY